MSTKLALVTTDDKPKTKGKRLSQSERIYQLKYLNEELTRQLERETERADLLSVQLEELIEDRDENYMPIESDCVAKGTDEVVSEADADRIELLADLETAQMRFDMGILTEADTIREIMWKLI